MRYILRVCEWPQKRVGINETSMQSDFDAVAAHGGRARIEEPCSGWQKKHRLLDASLHSRRQEMRPVSRTPIRPVSQLRSASLIIVRQKSADSSRFVILDSPTYGITVTSVAVTLALRRRVQGEGPEELHPSPQEFHGASRLDSKGVADVVSRFPRLLAQDQQRLCALPWSQFTDIRLRPAALRGGGWRGPLARIGLNGGKGPCWADFALYGLVKSVDKTRLQLLGCSQPSAVYKSPENRPNRTMPPAPSSPRPSAA
jgi:hypothetical protein